MKRLIIGVVIGLVAGSAATYLLVQSDRVSPYKLQFTQPKPIQDVPKMSVEAAETHRRSAYAELQTIEEILALPTDFAQTEALYSLAGRSDSAAVQGLIYQANQISNPMDRSGALQILFSRLTTLDPPSALALARTPDYASNSQLEAMIWGEWSENDFDNALIAAADLESDARRNNAAQGMYAAYGYTGNEKIAVIEDALAIRLDRNTKAQYLYALAARSPADAITYINEQVSSQDQQTLTYWLADFLGKNDPEGARQYAALFLKKRNSDLFLRYIDNAAASTDPETMLENALAESGTEQRTRKAYSALGMLALQDPDKAMSYLSRARNSQERQYFATAIARGLAETDPERALQWALEIDPADTLHVYSRVLSTIAREDPARAVNAVTSIQNMAKRNRALMQVLGTIAQSDPQLAASYLNQMGNKDVEHHVTSNIAMQWSRSDPEAAIEWAMTLDGPVRQQTLILIGTALASYDVEAAIRMLPRLDDQSATNLRVQIVSQMATRGSVAEAQAFLAQYEGTDDYKQMFSALVQATATVDFQSAMRMTHSLPNGIEKDGVLTHLAQQHVEVDPAESVRLISMISSQEQRIMTTSRLVSRWHRVDPDGVSAWARDLPRGEQRDSAIVGLAGAWDELTPSRKMLLKSVGDLEQRQQAQLSVVHKIARTDPATAERLVLEFAFTDQYRQQAEQALRQSHMRH